MGTREMTTWERPFCGALRAADTGRRVELVGWVRRRRDLGGIIFVDLRDREGWVQVLFPEEPLKGAGGGAVRRGRDPRGRHGAPARRPRWSTATWRPARSRSVAERLERAQPGRDAAVRGRGLGQRLGGAAPAPPLPRPAPAGDDGEPRAARPDHRRGAAVLPRDGVRRGRDADPDPLDARGRARLPGAVAAVAAARSTPCRSRPSSSSSSSRSPGSAATSRSPAASATRTCAPTASSSSPRSTSRPRSSTRRTSTPSSRACSRASSRSSASTRRGRSRA